MEEPTAHELECPVVGDPHNRLYICECDQLRLEKRSFPEEMKLPEYSLDEEW